MDIHFTHYETRGLVSVSCVPNDDPARFGKAEVARGFPVCTATIDFPADGYRAAFGWVQLVKSTDNASGGVAFEMDPSRFFEDSPAPFCFYGIRPILFDAPSRDDHQRLEWLAHSFLAFILRDRGAHKSAVPLLGFSWGFDIDASGLITLRPVELLSNEDWRRHVAYLSATYPSWEFSDLASLPWGQSAT